MPHLFPHAEEQIKSIKTPEDIYMILKSVTDSKKLIFPPNIKFIGQVHPLDFKIVPRIHYRNSFLPVITGTITEAEGETVIDIKAQIHLFTHIFLTIWFGGVCFFFLCGLLAVLVSGLDKIAFLLLPLGFIIFGQILIRCSFYTPT